MNQPIQLNFDASRVEPSVPFEALPAGEYIVATTGAEVNPTKANDGHLLKLEHTVVEGQYKGRKIFNRLNLWNKNPQAVEIAWRDLSALCHAASVLQVATVDQLFNIPVTVKLTTDGQYNEVKGYSKAGGNAPAPAWAGGQPQGEAGYPGSPQGGAPAPSWAAPAAPQAPSAPQPPAPGPAAPPAQPQASTQPPPWAAAQPQAPAAGAGQETPPWARTG